MEDPLGVEAAADGGARAVEDDAHPFAGTAERLGDRRAGAAVPVIGFDDGLGRLLEAAHAVAEGVERAVVVAHALDVVLEDALEADAVAAGGFAAAAAAAAPGGGGVAGDRGAPGGGAGDARVRQPAGRGREGA